MMHRIEAAADAAGCRPPQLIAVTKTVSPDVAADLCRLLRALTPTPPQLGENRADVLAAKRAAFTEREANEPRWHFIGSIQRNKARRILERADVLHSIDSVKLAGTVVRLADELERVIDVFIEVNLTGEDEKHGLLPDDVREVLNALQGSERIRVLGLMAMGPARGLKTVTEVFRQVADLAAELTRQAPTSFHEGRCRLSMGMSGDLETAVRFGSDFVRVGSALFEGLSPSSSARPPLDTPQDFPPGPAAGQPIQ
ncbi:MAG: YggS family pyridoxal phosphate-dependent enzyme [Planctomycetota bacterium]